MPSPSSERFRVENIRGTNVWLRAVIEIKDDVWIFDFERTYSDCCMSLGNFTL